MSRSDGREEFQPVIIKEFFDKIGAYVEGSTCYVYNVSVEEFENVKATGKPTAGSVDSAVETYKLIYNTETGEVSCGYDAAGYDAGAGADTPPEDTIENGD